MLSKYKVLSLIIMAGIMLGACNNSLAGNQTQSLTIENKNAFELISKNTDISSDILKVHKGKLKNDEPICVDLYKILNLSQNQSYIHDSYAENPFFIPANDKMFIQIIWTPSTEDNFKKQLPYEHEKLANYLERLNVEKSSGFKIFNVRMANIDVYNRGKKNKVFRVGTKDYQNNYLIEKNYLVEEDPVRKGFKRIFNDNALSDIPFIYGREVFWGSKTKHSLKIRQFGKMPSGKLPVRNVCEYIFKKANGDD